MRRLIITSLVLITIVFTPIFARCEPYSLEYVFNQMAIEEGIKMQYGAFLKNKGKDGFIELLNYGNICLDGLEGYYYKSSISSKSAIQAFQQFLTNQIISAAAFDIYHIDMTDKMLEENQQLMERTFNALKEKGLIKGSWDKFSYMYNNALNFWAPRIIKWSK